MNRAKLKGVLVLGGVFLLGALAGGASLFAWQRSEDAGELAAGPPERMARRHLRALVRELDLSAEQRDQVREVMQRHRSERATVLQEAQERCGAPLREHKAKVDAEIRALLTSEQQARFDELLQKQDERFPLGGPPRGRRDRGAGRPGGGPRGR